MKYAFIDSMSSLTYNNGIKIQAIMWKDGLEKLGHKVTLVNLWENIDFASFDAVIIFAMGENIYKLVNNLYRINKNIKSFSRYVVYKRKNKIMAFTL